MKVNTRYKSNGYGFQHARIETTTIRDDFDQVRVVIQEDDGHITVRVAEGITVDHIKEEEEDANA